MSEYDSTPGLNAEGISSQGPAKRPEPGRQNQKRQSGSQQGRASGPSQEPKPEPAAETLVKTEVSEPKVTEQETSAETFPIPEQVPEIIVAGKPIDDDDDDGGWEKVTGPVVGTQVKKEDDLKITVGGEKVLDDVSAAGLWGTVKIIDERKPAEIPPVENAEAPVQQVLAMPAGPFATCHDFVQAYRNAGCDDRGYAYPIVRAAFEAGQKSILLRSKSVLKPSPKF